jgi:hypothetical protein
MDNPVIPSEAKDPMPACATTGSARSFHRRPDLWTDHWPLITGH